MITPTRIEDIRAIVDTQRGYFRSHATLPLSFRRDMLKRLKASILRFEKELCDALYLDLHKSYEEAYMTEISIVLGEIDNFLENLGRWAAPSKKSTPLKLFPSRSMIITEPLGVALIMSPWNYPVQLVLNPLVGAIAAGCTAVIKPSPYVEHVAEVLERLIYETFDKEYITVVQGHRDVNTELLRQRYDVIFFTGSPDLGRVVMRAAADNATPVILELGGKSPVIVDRSADVPLAAKRLAWGKSLNAGQTCIAPDYVLIHEAVKQEFVEAFKQAIRKLHGENPQFSKHYVRMVSDKAFERVSSYIAEGRVLSGGRVDASDRYIEPTLIDNVAINSAVMTTEIFGPVLPLITIKSVDEAVAFINEREKPLALYVFASEGVGRSVLHRTSSGGACINDVIMHIANDNLPFGGVGNSGMGRYHGRDSLYSFSHRRAVIITPTWIDMPFRYMPYKLFRWIKRLM